MSAENVWMSQRMCCSIFKGEEKVEAACPTAALMNVYHTT